jgi:ABC-type Fe3+-hydroxamate transport system substrate-binding protein
MRKSLSLKFSFLTLIALAGVTSATGASIRAATSSSTTSATAGVATPVPSKVNRIVLAEDLEESLLKEGHDVRVKAQGKDGRILTVKWSLMGAQFVYKFTADDRLIKKLQNAGFSHIHFDNGDRFWDQQIE